MQKPKDPKDNKPYEQKANEPLYDESSKIEYYSNGKRKQITHYYQPTSTTETKKKEHFVYEFEDNEANKKTKYTSYDTDGIKKSEEEYKYDNAVNTTTTIYYVKKSNNEVAKESEYDYKESSITKITIYDPTTEHPIKITDYKPTITHAHYNVAYFIEEYEPNSGKKKN